MLPLLGVWNGLGAPFNGLSWNLANEPNLASYLNLRENIAHTTHKKETMMSDETPIIFTESCCAKVADLIAEENNPDLKLRVFVNGGGCSGFQYGFTFDEIKNDDDFEIVKDGLSFLIDPMSYQYLIGAEIDYTESLQGSQFVIRNPNATTTCGCGSSFSV